MIFASIHPAWSLPIVVSLGAWRIPIHPVMDMLAYGIGFRLYLWLLRRQAAPPLPVEQRAWIFVGCIFGALAGAKMLAWAESPRLYWLLRHDPAVWTGGKTIVGGLLGGWIGVEIAKRIQGVKTSTGDLFVFPLLLGMAIGRIGCFLTGPADQTWGGPTRLPWGIDPGNGIPLHPAPLYEILFLALLGAALWRIRRAIRTSGVLFRCFLIGYLGFRFAIEFLKPHGAYFGRLSAIQWACLIFLPVCWFSIMNLYSRPLSGPSHA